LCDKSARCKSCAHNDDDDDDDDHHDHDVPIFDMSMACDCARLYVSASAYRPSVRNKPWIELLCWLQSCLCDVYAAIQHRETNQVPIPMHPYFRPSVPSCVIVQKCIDARAKTCRRVQTLVPIMHRKPRPTRSSSGARADRATLKMCHACASSRLWIFT
jgi:hypothetical protein